MSLRIEGVWLPIITPFDNDCIDYTSYKKLIDFYITKGVNGIIPLGTTGESPVLTQKEYEELLDKTLEYCNKRVPVIAGFGGNSTKKIVNEVKILEKYDIDGILSVTPYYNKPDQRGIYQHFKMISESSEMPIVIYNIPHRTGRNITNNTLRKLAELKNIIGLKDSCGDSFQTMELLLDPPNDFSILTGEDLYFYFNLTLHGSGGIMATAHINTEMYVELFKLMKENNCDDAFVVWKKIAPIISLLFKEPNPGPLKYCLKKLGLITSPEIRLPLMEITDELKMELDKFLY